MMLPRPQLHKFLLSKVPAENIHFNKKVLSIIQNKEGAMIRCADGTTYHGDILVGADGAYSAVRQSLYKHLQDKNILPPSDAKDLNKGYTCLVGTTNPLDPVKYPYVTQDHSESFWVIEEGSQYTWSLVNVPDNRICYLVVRQFETFAECENEKFRNSEWGPERSASMVENIKNFKLPWGGTLNDLIRETPKNTVSRVYLEDKLFETWTHGRTVLIGDAAHKVCRSSFLVRS
jgi:2-polyprenyl-6-methoxyphenol hydroxylase-like FAD-dependent oxidoreductase